MKGGGGHVNYSDEEQFAFCCVEKNNCDGHTCSHCTYFQNAMPIVGVTIHLKLLLYLES